MELKYLMDDRNRPTKLVVTCDTVVCKSTVTLFSVWKASRIRERVLERVLFYQPVK